MSYIKKSWTIEHDWQCVYCKHINKGRDDKCINCGKDIDEENCEIIPTDMSYENRVKDASVNRKLTGNPDWICNYCNHRERDEKLVCTECGANKHEKKKTVSSGQDTTFGSGTIPAPKDEKKENLKEVLSSTIVEKSTEKLLSTPYRQNNYIQSKIILPIRKIPIKRICIITGSLIGFIGFIWLLYWLFAMHLTTAIIQETHWNYSVSLHQRTIHQGHDWQNSMHSHAFNVSCHTEIRNYYNCNPYSCNPHSESYRCNPVRTCTPYESCQDVCRNSGRRSSSCRTVCRTRQVCRTTYSTCSRIVRDTCWNRCPNYDQMCDYQYPEWLQINRENTNGINHTPIRPNLRAEGNRTCPLDPEILYSSGVTQCTTEEITFDVTMNAGNHGQYTIHPSSLEEYNRYQIGDIWNVEYNHAGQFRVLGKKEN